MGLVARSCHFDVTACAEARRLAQRAERPLRGLLALWASRRASRAGWIKSISLFAQQRSTLKFSPFNLTVFSDQFLYFCLCRPSLVHHVHICTINFWLFALAAIHSTSNFSLCTLYLNSTVFLYFSTVFLSLQAQFSSPCSYMHNQLLFYFLHWRQFTLLQTFHHLHYISMPLYFCTS